MSPHTKEYNINNLLFKTIKLIIFYFSRFHNNTHVTAMSLVYLKTNIVALLTSKDFTNDILFEGLGDLSFDFNFQNMYFPHTHNILIRNRETICQW